MRIYGAQHQVIENSGKLAQMPPETPAVCNAGPSAHGRGRREKKTAYSLQPCTAQSSATPSVMWVITGPDIDVLHTGRKTGDREMKESVVVCIYISEVAEQKRRNFDLAQLKRHRQIAIHWVSWVSHFALSH